MQYPDLYDKLADRCFQAFDDAGIFDGQMRTLAVAVWKKQPA